MSVYFALAPNGLMKIGYSQDPVARVKALQSGHKRPLQLLKTVYGARTEEAAFHRQFKEYRIWGEWFHLTGRLLKFIGRKRPPAKPAPRSIDELVREAITNMVALGYTDEQMADALKVSNGTVYNLLRELNLN